MISFGAPWDFKWLFVRYMSEIYSNILSWITLSVASIGSPHAAHDMLCRSIPIMALIRFWINDSDKTIGLFPLNRHKEIFKSRQPVINSINCHHRQRLYIQQWLLSGQKLSLSLILKKKRRGRVQTAPNYLKLFKLTVL